MKPDINEYRRRGYRYIVCDVTGRVHAKYTNTDRDKSIQYMIDSNVHGACDAVKPYYVHDTVINEQIFASPADINKYSDYHRKHGSTFS